MIEKATRYMRMPFFVTGHQVTPENMRAVAQWCEGHVIETEDRTFIRVPISGIKNIRQTEACEGDHILKMTFDGKVTWKIEKDVWLGQRFVTVEIHLDDSDDLEIGPVKEPSRPVNNLRVLPSQPTRVHAKPGPRPVRTSRVL
jgi:hypothetical protein